MPDSFNVTVRTPRLDNCVVGYAHHSRDIVVYGPCGPAGDFPLAMIPDAIAAAYKQCPDILTVTVTAGRPD